MTSYLVERPSRSPRTAPALVHLRPGEATPGQPVTIRSTDTNGNVIREYPAVYVRTDRLHLRCQGVESGETRRYRPSEVFPRSVPFRRWTVTLVHRAITPDGDRGEEYPVTVSARTELEARAQAARQINDTFGNGASPRFSFRSAREG